MKKLVCAMLSCALLLSLAAMTDIDVASVTYTPLLSDPGGKALLEIAKEAAINAVGSPKEPTQSAFTQM